jgi:hypothetical protein
MLPPASAGQIYLMPILHLVVPMLHMLTCPLTFQSDHY